MLSSPSAVVQFAEVTAQSVAIDVYFWVKMLKDVGQIKSDLLVAIGHLLQDNDIQLAIVQQEINIVRRPAHQQPATDQNSG